MTRVLPHLLLALTLLASAVCYSQPELPVLIATSQQYGGSVYHVGIDGSEFTYDKVFAPDGGAPWQELATDGTYLYGVTNTGGVNNVGIIYRVKPDGSGFQKLHDFNGENGALPSATLEIGSDGMIYGVTTYGAGINQGGTIFKIKNDGSNFQVLHHLQMGENLPSDKPILASDGKLYGMNIVGGVNYTGAIYSMDTNGNNYTTIYSFPSGDDGNNQLGGAYLTEGLDGKLYGTRAFGGVNDKGVVFSISKNGSNFLIIHSFATAEGANPQAGVIQHSDGRLFGMTVIGGQFDNGTVYSVNPNGTDFKVLKHFQFLGANPRGALSFNSAGKLVGIAEGPGYSNSNADAVVFECGLDGSGFTAVFTETDVYLKYAYRGSLVVVGNKYYGIRQGEYAGDWGSVFEVDPATNKAKTIHAFDVVDGYYPGNLTPGPAGLLYGTTGGMGPNDRGAFYSFNPVTKEFKVIHHFSVDEVGAQSLSYIGDDYFIGVSSSNWSFSSGGSIIRFKSDGSDVKLLRGFSGAEPRSVESEVIVGDDGFLYGTLYYGGPADRGGIYRMDRDGGSYEVLHTYSSDALGSRPYGNITKGPDGALYGATINGGANDSGTLFRFDPATLTYTKLLDYKANESWYIGDSRPELARNGKLYVPIPSNGFGSFTNIYEITPGANASIKLFTTFSGVRFANSLTQSPDGDFYSVAMTSISGGASLYKFKGNGTTVQKLQDFPRGCDWSSKLIFFSNEPSPQTIAFPPMAERKFTSVPFKPVISVSSGLPITLSSNNTAVATTSGSMITLVGLGTVTITASQNGNELFLPAQPVQQALVVVKGTQKIILSVADKTLGDLPFDLPATATSGLQITYSTTSDEISLTGNKVTLTKPGHVSIEGKQAGNDLYEAAAIATTSFCVNPSKPVITISGTSASRVLTSSNESGNQWFRNLSPIINATGKTLAVTQDGSYTVNTKIEECASVLSEATTITIVGLEDSDNGISVYPNPARNFVEISTGHSTGAGVAITLVDMLGRAVETRPSTPNSVERFDLTNLNSGLFGFRLQAGGIQKTVRFLKD